MTCAETRAVVTEIVEIFVITSLAFYTNRSTFTAYCKSVAMYCQTLLLLIRKKKSKKR